MADPTGILDSISGLKSKYGLIPNGKVTMEYIQAVSELCPIDTELSCFVFRLADYF